MTSGDVPIMVGWTPIGIDFGGGVVKMTVTILDMFDVRSRHEGTLVFVGVLNLEPASVLEEHLIDCGVPL